MHFNLEIHAGVLGEGKKHQDIVGETSREVNDLKVLTFLGGRILILGSNSTRVGMKVY